MSLWATYGPSGGLDYWILQWWIREEKRVYFRVDCEGAIMEIFKRDGEWVLARVLD